MSIKIAVIGSYEFMERLHTLDLEDLEIDPYIYKEPKEAAELVRELKPCDAIFFSGALPFYFSKQVLENVNIPALYLAQDEMAVATSLLAIIFTKKIPPERISVDLMDAAILTNVLDESGINQHPLWVMDYQKLLTGPFDLEELVNFHHSLWKQGKIDIALTSVHAVYSRLTQMGVPALRMADPRSSLLRGLQEAKNQAALFKSRAAQVAVGYLSIENLQQDQTNKLGQLLQAYVQKLTPSLFVLYSTRGEMEPNRLHDFLETYPDEITIGFGYGATIKEADQNAKIALRFAEKEDTAKCGYILMENKELLGPFPFETKQHRLKNDNPEFLQIAKQTKLSPANLSKIIEFGKARKSLNFTAADLADYLQVTRRSTERLVKKLVEHGYIKVVGEEMVYHQGRPRALYELNLPIYQ
nr:transcriptional regulator [Neobacillus sp. Marseille-Q6967]